MHFHLCAHHRIIISKYSYFCRDGVFLFVTEKKFGQDLAVFVSKTDVNSTDWDLSKSPLPFPRKNDLSSPLTMFLWNIHIWVSDGGARGATEERMKPFKVADQDFHETTSSSIFGGCFDLFAKHSGHPKMPADCHFWHLVGLLTFVALCWRSCHHWCQHINVNFKHF